jgi:hypothetical protein
MAQESLARRLISAINDRSTERYNELLVELRSPELDRVALFRALYRKEGFYFTVTAVGFMTPSELQQVFPELVSMLYGQDGWLDRIRDGILKIPRSWLLTNIEDQVETHLQNGDYSDFIRTIEIYRLIDSELARNLANRCLRHHDPDIREIGSSFLHRPE